MHALGIVTNLKYGGGCVPVICKYYVFLYSGLGQLQVWASRGVLKPTAHGYCRMTVLFLILREARVTCSRPREFVVVTKAQSSEYYLLYWVRAGTGIPGRGVSNLRPGIS